MRKLRLREVPRLKVAQLVSSKVATDWDSDSDTHTLFAPLFARTVRPGPLLRICIHDVRLRLWAALPAPGPATAK